RYNHDLDADTSDKAANWPGWPSSLNRRSHAAYRLVRRLTFKSDLPSIFSGKALQLLSREPFGNDLFSKTRVVKVDLYLCEVGAAQQLGAAVNLSCAEANISAFVRRIKQLAPMVNEIVVEPQFEPFLETLPNFTRITYDHLWCDRDVDGQFMRMVRQSAQILQYLFIKARDIEDALVPRPVTSGAISFPSLWHLSIGDLYPFGDDTPFRGNAAMLKYLHIMLRRKTCDILRRFSVFTPTSHPKLQCVRTCKLPPDEPDDFQDYNDLVQFTLSIAPNAAVRDIGVSVTVDDTFHAFDVLKSYANIQVLF
ncbi:hypothetical protein GGH95_002888, partial [Coemansia sp. RSA 1836]